MDTLHVHPLDPNEKVIGRPVETGETLQSRDVYDSTTGKWEPVPYHCIGNLVEERHGAIFIRPAAQRIAEHLGAGGLAYFETH